MFECSNANTVSSGTSETIIFGSCQCLHSFPSLSSIMFLVQNAVLYQKLSKHRVIAYSNFMFTLVHVNNSCFSWQLKRPSLHSCVDVTAFIKIFLIIIIEYWKLYNSIPAYPVPLSAQRISLENWWYCINLQYLQGLICYTPVLKSVTQLKTCERPTSVPDFWASVTDM